MEAALSRTEQFARAQLLLKQGQVSAARQVYQQILDADPGHFGALAALGMLAGQANDLPGAEKYFERAVAAAPDDSAAQCNLGVIRRLLGRWESALECFDRAVELDGRNAIAYHCRAETHAELGRLQEAVADYGRALESSPAHFESHAKQALALFALGRYREALASCDRAIALRPDQAPAYVLRGDLLRALDQLPAALASYDRALAIDPQNAEGHCNRCAALQRLDRLGEALTSAERAIAIKPDYAEAHFHRAYLLRMFQHFDAAKAAYKTVAGLAPAFEFLPGNRIEADLHVCDWSDYGTLVPQIEAGIESDARVSNPFIFMALSDSARRQHRAARIWARFACPANDALGPLAPRQRPPRLTVGYFSADLHLHPIARLIAELIEIHDRSRFAVVAFSFGPEVQDEYRQRLARAFDRFIDVREKSSLEIAALARSLEVDIAVDLGGYSQGARPGIFALRAAPVQVSYLGYLGTMGAGYMDYIVADRTVVTADSADHFSEKIIYMPDSHQVNDRRRRIAEHRFTREQLRLPASGFVFCCFNTSYKISPATFAAWMRILQAVPGSALFLYAAHAAAERNLRAAAARHGVDPQRLVFGARLPPDEYLARYRAADLFLDTAPYNAGTTASDALWAGLPVLTFAGRSFASRTAASLLTALGVPELITSTPQEYERLAIELALDPERMATIRAKVRERRLVSPLFDTPRFARNLEAGFTAAYERYLAGAAPDHIAL
jgi:predicted O-linked N-acetylglucosamine transferase (SPINDLY family)